MIKRVSDSESDTVDLESIKREPTSAVVQLQFIVKDNAGLQSKRRHASRLTLPGLEK
jgi:hypothetical protein